MGKKHVHKLIPIENNDPQLKLFGEFLLLLSSVLKSLSPRADNPEPFAVRTVCDEIDVAPGTRDVLISLEIGDRFDEVMEALGTAKPHIQRIIELIGHEEPQNIEALESANARG